MKKGVQDVASNASFTLLKQFTFKPSLSASILNHINTLANAADTTNDSQALRPHL